MWLWPEMFSSSLSVSHLLKMLLKKFKKSYRKWMNLPVKTWNSRRTHMKHLTASWAEKHFKTYKCIFRSNKNNCTYTKLWGAAAGRLHEAETAAGGAGEESDTLMSSAATTSEARGNSGTRGGSHCCFMPCRLLRVCWCWCFCCGRIEQKNNKNNTFEHGEKRYYLIGVPNVFCAASPVCGFVALICFMSENHLQLWEPVTDPDIVDVLKFQTLC